MKSLRMALIGLAVFGMVSFLSGVSFAQETQAAGKERHETKIKLFQDSAAALQKSNPDLAKGLNDYADKEAKEIQEWKAQHEAKVKLLKDAAAALQQTRPDLAKSLEEMTVAKHKTEMQKAIEEENEKEEVGENVEPKSEQGENK